MINWQKAVPYAFNEKFQCMFFNKGMKKYVDDQVKKANYNVSNFSGIAWDPLPTKSETKIESDIASNANASVYEWKAISVKGKICVLISEEGDFVGIIDSGKDMLYVANICCHPVVATNTIVFLNSDGSTGTQFPKQLLNQNGSKVAQYLSHIAVQFIEKQIH